MRSRLFVLFALLVLPLALWAGGTQLGTISGRVIDQAGAAVPGATVEVTNLEKGASRTAVTDAQGNYLVPLLLPGRYKVAISLAGFDTFVAENTVVAVDKTTLTSTTPLTADLRAAGGFIARLAPNGESRIPNPESR